MNTPTRIDRFSKKTWRKSAPAAVVLAYTGSDEQAGRAAWLDHLDQKPAPPLHSAGAADMQFIRWGLDEAGIQPSLLNLLSAAGKGKKAPRLEKACSDSIADIDALGLADALNLIALAHAMPRLVSSLTDPAWWLLLDQLYAIAEDASVIDRFAAPLAHVLLACELPLVIGVYFTELGPCHKLVKPASKTLSASLVDLLDGEGLPGAENFDRLRALLACWTRCQLLTDDESYRPLSKDAKNQYDWLVRQAMRVTRADGRTVFSHSVDVKKTAQTDSLPVDASLFRAALRLGGDDDDDQIAQLAIPTLVEPRAMKKKADRRRVRKAERWLPESSYESEWASAAILRTSWRADSTLLAVASPGLETLVELQVAGRSLLRGSWDFDIRVDGKKVAQINEWEQTCWTSEEEIDFFEIEAELDRGVSLQRHVALLKDDSLALLADVVICSEPTAKIEYRAPLPLARGFRFSQADESNEGHLTDSKHRATALPLSLSEWQADRRSGHLDISDDGAVTMHMCSQGPNLYAAWLIDMDKKRLSSSLTWRHLTVAEYLVPQPPSVAVGYRIAIGDEQWLIYRSLAKSGNRTLLGHNLSTQMLIARFDETGAVEPLVEVE